MRSAERKGFTLVELLIGAVLMTIVIAGIALGINMCYRIYQKTEAHSVVVRGLRFTMDSYSRTVVPLLHSAYSIDILEANSNIETALSDDEYYLFLSGDAVTLRSKSGDVYKDEPLNGSECIRKLYFRLPAGKTAVNDFMLSVDILASKDEEVDSLDVVKSLDIRTALYNKPEKMLNLKSNKTTGPALKFFSNNKSTTLTDRINLFNKYNHENINKDTVPDGTDVSADYISNLKLVVDGVPADKSEYKDNGTGDSLKWFIAKCPSGVLASVDLNSLSWNQLVNADGTAITSGVLSTPSDDKYYVGSGTPWSWPVSESYMLLRCSVQPKVLYNGRQIDSNPKIVSSDYVRIQKSNATSPFWNGWADAVKNGYGDDFTKEDLPGNKIILSADSNNTITAYVKSSAPTPNAQAVTTAKLRYNWFENDRVNSIWRLSSRTSADLPSYMTVTNYSVIIDAEISADIDNGKRNGADFWGLMLNCDKDGKDGIVFQFERNRGWDNKYDYDKDDSQPGLLMRKFTNGALDGYENTSARSAGLYNLTDHKSVSEDQRYLPENLKNNAFNFYSGSASSDDAWFQRRRVMITVLEYYKGNSSASTIPYYIVRVKFLKRTDGYTPQQLAVIKKTDPWCIGKEFFASEPMWFGAYVGNSLSNNTTDVKHFSYPSDDIKTATLSYSIANDSNKIYYGTRFKPAGQSSGNPLVVKGVEMSQTARSVNRERYVGIRTYSRYNKANIKLYDESFAPGFSANEIRSIMPKDGKVYEIKDTLPADAVSVDYAFSVSADWYVNNDYANNFNYYLFGSNGASEGDGQNINYTGKPSLYYTNAGLTGVNTPDINGKRFGGLYDLQHINDTCKCPLHNELFRWISLVQPESAINAFTVLIEQDGSQEGTTKSQVYTFWHDKNRLDDTSKRLDSAGKTWAPLVRPELEALLGETDLTNYAWAMQVKKQSDGSYNYYIFWSSDDMTAILSNSATINAMRGIYNTKTKDLAISNGTVKVSVTKLWESGVQYIYSTIDMNSFVLSGS